MWRTRFFLVFLVFRVLLVLGPFFTRPLVFCFFCFFWFGALPPEDLGLFHCHRTLVVPLPEDLVFSAIFSAFPTFLRLGGGYRIYIYMCQETWAKWRCSIHSHDTKQPHILFWGYPFCDKHGDMMLSKDCDTQALGMQNGVRCFFASSCAPLRNSPRTLD